MGGIKKSLLLYPNQLFAVEHIPQDVDEIVLVEEPLLFGSDRQYGLMIHKQKLVLLRASMNRYMKEELWPAGYSVTYIDHHKLTESGDIVEKLKDFTDVYVYEFSDDILSRRVMEAIRSHPEAPAVSVLQSPNFYISHEESDRFFSERGDTSFQAFYQWQRERFNVLIDPETYKPLEGSWEQDHAKRKRIPKSTQLPSFQVFGSNEYVDEAEAYVEKYFSGNPGSLNDFPWPTSRVEAMKWLDEFASGRLGRFAAYSEAIDGEAPWLHHPAVNHALNIGLLSPHDIVQAVVAQLGQGKVRIEDVELVVRGVLGWREYYRGVYRKRHTALRTANTFGHTRRMTVDWYRGTTGIPPVDDVILKIHDRSYTHETEQLMVIGNICFLSEFHPDEVYRWFMEMCGDMYEWLAVPFVYGVSQGAAFAKHGTLPAISSSNYIRSMSHYKKGDWCDIWDGLYWRAIEKNAELFKTDPMMKKAYGQLKRLNTDRRRIISYRAEDFLRDKTQGSS